MADQISVNFAALDNSSAVLSSQAQALNGYIQQLIQSLNPMKQTWVQSGSSAGAAAQQAETKLTNATNEIISTITQFSSKVADARSTQYTLEQQNTNLFTT